MIASEKLYRRDFWLGSLDARPLALFRVGFAFVLLVDYLDRLREFHTFYVDGGLMPVARDGRPAWLWWAAHAVGSPAGVGALFAVGIVAAVALGVGFRPRIAAVVAWLFERWLETRNDFVLDGADTVVRTLLLWLIFCDSGAAWSVDARARGPRRVFAFPVRMLQLQIAMLHTFAGLYKHGRYWRDGTAIWRALHVHDFARDIGAIVAHSPSLCALLTHGTRVVEALFVVLVFFPWATRRTRAVGLIATLALHFGIYLTMRVGLFSLVVPMTLLPFLLPEWLDRVPRLRLRVDAAAPPPATRARPVIVVALAVQMVLVAWSNFSGLVAHPRLRPFVAAEIYQIGLNQRWKMFAPDPRIDDVEYEAPGHLVDDTPLDVLAAAAPKVAHDNSWFFSRWYRLRASLYDTMADSRDVREAFGSYVCRRYNGNPPGPMLRDFELVYVLTRGTAPGEPPASPRRLPAMHQRCF